jgi:predicted nucleic-acid-binding protein
MQKTLILDTNAILRYLLKDNLTQANHVVELLTSNIVTILPEVIAEVVYVLTKVYSYTRKDTSDIILNFLTGIECESQLIISATETYGKENLDFVDCLLLQYSKHKDYKVFTFDEKLKKLLDKT